MPQRTRCKFKCHLINNTGTPESPGASIHLSAICDDDKQIPEDEAFTRYTPYGELRMGITNPAVLPMFKEGGVYYIDISSVEPVAPAIASQESAAAIVADGGVASGPIGD